jgi:hypothetical protein
MGSGGIQVVNVSSMTFEGQAAHSGKAEHETKETQV